jgi:hypothetical protein
MKDTPKLFDFIFYRRILSEEINALKAENQKLRDEINLLKGEQTKPKVRGSKKNDISSENERKERTPLKTRDSNTRKDKIEIHHTEICRVDKSILPNDAVLKVIVALLLEISSLNLGIPTTREIFYSPSECKTYFGDLPDGVKGEFGPRIRTHVLTLYHAANVSEPKIHEFFENIGVLISTATISRFITEDNSLFDEEKSDTFKSGLNSTTYQQIEDTSARVNGNNWYTQIICNPYYAAYFTVPHKNRGFWTYFYVEMKKMYCFNVEAFKLMEMFNVSRFWIGLWLFAVLSG